MDIGQVIALLAALGAGGIGKTLLDHLLARRKGRMQEEQTAWERYDAVRAHLDAETEFRRRLEEAYQQTRHCWNAEAGKLYDQMPPWPRRPDRK